MSSPPVGRQIRATVHGRYLVRPGPAGPAPLLVGFHGYGQSAEEQLRALEAIPGAAPWLLAAVQGLHPFYKAKTGEVVASWMTRLDRELAIADNIAYVGAAVEAIRSEWPTSGGLVYAGFSQGVAMAYRAAAGAGHPCQGVIALAGDVPPELAAGDLAGFPPVLLGRGLEDDWYDEGKLAADLEVLSAKGVEVSVCRFPGGHEWGEGFCRACGEFLAGLLSRSP